MLFVSVFCLFVFCFFVLFFPRGVFLFCFVFQCVFWVCLVFVFCLFFVSFLYFPVIASVKVLKIVVFSWFTFKTNPYEKH